MDAKTNVTKALYEGVELLIGGRWVTASPKIPFFPGLWASSVAKEQKMNYGAYHSSRPSTQKDKATFQCVLSEQDTAGGKPASLLISAGSSHWPEFDQNKTLVFILSVSDINGDNYYWISAISPNGIVISEYERLHKNVYDVLSSFSEIELTEQPHYYYVEDDNSSLAIIEQYRERALIDFTATPVEKRLVLSAFNNKKIVFKKIHSSSSIELKKAGLALSAITLATVLFSAYSYIDIRESSSWLTSDEEYDHISRKKSELQQLSNAFKSSKSWTESSYKDEVIEQFIGSLPTGLSAPEISMTIKEIERTMPLFAVDWSMTKITYVSGDFLIFYQRDKKGKGVFFLLDKVIGEINQRQNSLSIEGHALINNAETRVYKVNKSDSTVRNLEKSEMLKRHQAEKNIQSEMKRLLQKMLEDISSVESHRNDYNSLTFTEKWIEKKGKELYESALVRTEHLKSLEPKLADAKKRLKDTPKAEIKNDWILGSVLDFVTLMQTDSLFTWSYPEVVKTYPDSKTLKERAAKKYKPKKNDKKSQKQQEKSTQKLYGPAIETYLVEVSTQESEGDGKVLSYGVLDMLQLALLIDKPFINVDNVEYDPVTEQWKLVLLFNRRTPEFTQRMLNAS